MRRYKGNEEFFIKEYLSREIEAARKENKKAIKNKDDADSNWWNGYKIALEDTLGSIENDIPFKYSESKG